MKELDSYNKALEAVYNYFGYKENWRVFPIDDRRNYWWRIDDLGCEVRFYDTKKAYEKEDDSHTYSDEILPQKGIYEGKDYTMILVDTHTDGNVFLAIYDNNKKLNLEP
jgi:hypothetical protein